MWGSDSVFFLNFLFTQGFISAPMSRTEHIYILPYQLTIIFIRCEHVGLYTFLSSLNRHSTNDIISLKTIHLEDGNVVGLEYVFDDWHRELDVFRCLFSLGFIGRKSLMAEGLTMVESYCDMSWFLLGKYLVEGIAEPHDTRSVEPLGIDSWSFDKGVIRAINERIRV